MKRQMDKLDENTLGDHLSQGPVDISRQSNYTNMTNSMRMKYETG